MLKAENLFDLSRSIAGAYLKSTDAPYLIFDELDKIISELARELDFSLYERRGKNIFISKGARVSDSAVIGENTIIERGTEVRTGAFIRGNAIIGCDTVIGNSCEIKNAIIFDKAQIPHFNYVGDSIIGYGAHLGAGVICSNLRSDKKGVKIRLDDEIIDTGMRKIGALVGDRAEIGCNSVLCPGSVIGRGAMVYPLSLVRGFVTENSIFKG